MVVGGSCHHATKETNGSARQERQSSVCPAAKLAKEDTTASAYVCLIWNSSKETKPEPKRLPNAP